MEIDRASRAQTVAPDPSEAYMVLRDAHTTHTRRVRIMLLTFSAVLVVFGSAYAVFFALRADWFVTTGECVLVGVGLAVAWMTSRKRIRAATVVINLSLFAVFVTMALFMDVPSASVPRSVHYFLVPLAIAAFLMLKGENTWLHQGIPVLCLGTAAFFASTDFAFSTSYAVPDDVRRGGIWANNGIAMGSLYLLVYVFAGDINRMENYLNRAHNRFVGLVGGMFPRTIAERLLSQGEAFAERHANCSILFADIVGFTGMAERMAPEKLVALLSRVFEHFDQCVERRGLTKIKTIGDAYMVASGVPEATPDHARVLVELARDMLLAVRAFEGLQLRIGIASGELVAGVIGQSRQLYDVWGDVVNVAARMESHGLPGRIQVSQSSYELVADQFEFDLRPGITIKGKDGTHDVYVLREA